MKLAFTLIVHKAPDQAVRLATAVCAGGNYCLIHCNANSGPAFRAEIAAGLAAAGVTTARFLDSDPIVWGSSSILRVQMRAIRAMCDWADDWTHLINLSGQCLPVKPLAEIEDFLFAHRDRSFLELIDVETERPDLAHRFDTYHVEIAGRPRNTHIPRIGGRSFRMRFGAFWVMLSREACAYVIHDPRSQEIQRYLRYAQFPDELAFQTILSGSPLAGRLVPDMKRYILWEGTSPNPVVLTTSHWPAMERSGALFARKFDPGVDASIISRIGDRIGADLTNGTSVHA